MLHVKSVLLIFFTLCSRIYISRWANVVDLGGSDQDKLKKQMEQYAATGRVDDPTFKAEKPKPKKLPEWEQQKKVETTTKAPQPQRKPQTVCDTVDSVFCSCPCSVLHSDCLRSTSQHSAKKKNCSWTTLWPLPTMVLAKLTIEQRMMRMERNLWTLSKMH